jgi:serine/threonine protein kinase
MSVGALEPNMIVGPFMVAEAIARGGMATVYRAQRQDRPGGEVALKISRFAESDKRYGDAVRFEANLLEHLDHPNIVKLVPIPVPNQRVFPSAARAMQIRGNPWYYAMEYMEGGSLLTYVEKGGRLAIDVAVSIAYQVARGLLYMHKMGYAHLDTKVENILFRYPVKKGALLHVVLVDFGVSAQNVRGMQATGGTLLIMAPERLTPPEPGDPPLDAGKMDVYSLGVTMYRILTGQYPFIGNSQRTLISAILNDPVTPPNEHRADIPPDIAGLVMACLAKDQIDRIGLPELVADLERLPYRITRLTRELGG